MNDFVGKYAENQQKVWKISDNLLFLLCLKISVMRSVQDYITIIRQNSSKITNDFGIKTERDDLSDLEVLVLEVKAENPNNKIDEDILRYFKVFWQIFNSGKKRLFKV